MAVNTSRAGVRRAALLAVPAVLVGAGAGVRPGFVLNNDSVAVPEQDLLPWMWGAGAAPPRAVPQDAIVALADNLVPGWLVQRTLIGAGLVLLAWAVAHLLRERSLFEQVGAATVAVWSTFVFERAVMGHWGLILGVASMPWVLSAAQDVRTGADTALPRLWGWVLLGSWVPTGGLLALLAATAVLLWPGTQRRRRLLAMVGALGVQLVWIVPGVRTAAMTPDAAAEVFGLRGEGVAGPLLTSLGTGGLWNSSAMPASRLGVMSVVAPLVLVALAALGVAGLRTLPRPVVGSLLILAALGLTWANLTALPVAAPAIAAVQGLPGGGLLRDAQKWLAPWLILLSVSAGLGMGRVRRRFRDSEAMWPITVLLLAVPLLLLPDLALGAGGRLRPVTYPAEWNQVRAALADSAAPGDVVSLPWSSFRAYDWNADRTLLDPAPRYLPRTVVTDSRLLVGSDDGLRVVASDDPRSVRVGAALRSADPRSGLLELGIGWVLWQDEQPATPGYPADIPSWLGTGARTVVESGGLTLIELAGAPQRTAPVHSGWPLLAAWAVWIGLACVVLAGLVRYSWRRFARVRGLDVAGSDSVRADE